MLILLLAQAGRTSKQSNVDFKGRTTRFLILMLPIQEHLPNLGSFSYLNNK